MTLTSREYQVEAEELALASIDKHGGYALLMEQRSGKSHPALRVAKRLQPARLLVVCPNIAIEDIWQSNLPAHGLKGEVEVIGWKSLWNGRKRLRRWKPDMIIADELHNAKDPNSKQSRALRMIARRAKRDGTIVWQCPARLGLTGTPQESGLEDYWAQFDFVDPKLFGEWNDFQRDFLIKGGFWNKQVVGYRKEEEFRKLLASRSFRVLLEDVKPVKTNIAPPNVIYFELCDSRPHYDSMEAQFIVELNKKVRVRKLLPDGSSRFVLERKKIIATRVITQAMKLHQVSGGFIRDEEGHDHHVGNEKLELAGALMLALGGVPQVYFVRFIPELIRLGRLFTLLGRKVTYIAGKKSLKLLPEQPRYISGTPFDVAVVQIASGVAIDLAHAEEAVLYSWDHSHLKHDQAKFRIRSFTAKRARYHYLVGRRTIDEQLLQVVLDKLSFASLIVDKYRRRR